MSYIWNTQEEQLLRQLVKINKSTEEIYKTFVGMNGLDNFKAVRTERSINEKIKKLGLTPDPQTDLEKNLSVLNKICDQYAEECLEQPEITSSKERFILSLSDVHVPFTDPKRLHKVLETHKQELSNPNSIIILNGDIMDEYAASSFPKFKEVHLLHEYRAAFALTKMCLDYCGQIALVVGNHENRLLKTASENLPKGISDLYSFNLLARIANGEVLDEKGYLVDIDKNMKARIRYQYKEPWYCRIGKTIFAHPSGFASAAVPGSTATKTNKLFNSRYTKDDYDCLVLGHTHMQSKVIVDGRLLIEQGALCGLLGYEGKSNLQFGFSTNGYAVVYQDNKGNTNFNDSNFISLGQSLPKKKPLTWNK